MNLSKTTINFAQRRGIDVTLEEDFCEDFKDGCVWLWGSSEMEPEFIYGRNGDGTLSFVGALRTTAYEVPECISSEKQLREVIALIASKIKA